MCGQPRGDSSRVAAVRVPSLLEDALLRPLKGGHIGAVTSDGVLRPSKDDFLLDPGGSGLGRRGWHRLRPLLNSRRRFDALLLLVFRGSLGSYRWLYPWSRYRNPLVIHFAGVADLRVSAILHATLRVFLQAVHVRAAATLTTRGSGRSS